MINPTEFPWYDLVSNEGQLDQGDILFNCPVVQLGETANWPLPDNSKLNTIPIRIATIDAIVMTQTCDLFQDPKPENIIICRHVPAAGTGKDKWNEIIKGRRPPYAMLNESNIKEVPMGQRIVELSAISFVPLSLAQKVALASPYRLRLRPPYREHISQALARFFMRVGLPQDIDQK